MKVVVAGGRDFKDLRGLSYCLDSLVHSGMVISEIVSGKAKGADSLGESYAEARRIPVAEFPADWNGLGKKAGYVRNAQMAEYGDVLVAFWDGKSRGTKMMIKLAKSKGLKVIVFDYECGRLHGAENSKVRLIEGNLFETDAEIICHGCNCFNTMGKGVAKEMAKRYPEAKRVDSLTVKGDRSKMGQYTLAVENGKYIANLYTQYTFWDKNDMFSIDALRSSLQSVLDNSIPRLAVAVPAIGLGLANGVPEEVFKVIQDVADENLREIRLYILEPDLIQAFRKFELGQ